MSDQVHSNARRRYYRYVCETVLRWYVEYEDGFVANRREGYYFDIGVLDFRIDVEHALARSATPQEQLLLLLIHRDGIGYTDAIAQSRCVISARPDHAIGAIEAKVGREFSRCGLQAFSSYLLGLTSP